jgi:hypothetical protein
MNERLVFFFGGKADGFLWGRSLKWLGARVASVRRERIETTRPAIFHVRFKGHLGGKQFEPINCVHDAILERMV